MHVQLIRSATMRWTYAGHTFLTDPYFAPRGWVVRGPAGCPAGVLDELGGTMTLTRGHGAVLLLAGVVLVILAVAGSRHTLTARRDAQQDVAQLRTGLDSVRAAVGSALTAADSARLAAEIQDREYYLGRREYHLAASAPSGAPWRRPFGVGTVLLGGGLVLALLGAAVLARSIQHVA